MYTIKCTIYYIKFSKTQSSGHLACHRNWLKCKMCGAILSSPRPATAKPHPFPRLRQPGTWLIHSWLMRLLHGLASYQSSCRQELVVTIIIPETQSDACYRRSGFLWALEEYCLYTVRWECRVLSEPTSRLWFCSLWEFDRPSESDVSLHTHLPMPMQWRCADK